MKYHTIVNMVVILYFFWFKAFTKTKRFFTKLSHNVFMAAATDAATLPATTTSTDDALPPSTSMIVADLAKLDAARIHRMQALYPGVIFTTTPPNVVVVSCDPKRATSATKFYPLAVDAVQRLCGVLHTVDLAPFMDGATARGQIVIRNQLADFPSLAAHQRIDVRTIDSKAMIVHFFGVDVGELKELQLKLRTFLHTKPAAVTPATSAAPDAADEPQQPLLAALPAVSDPPPPPSPQKQQLPLLAPPPTTPLSDPGTVRIALSLQSAGPHARTLLKHILLRSRSARIDFCNMVAGCLKLREGESLLLSEDVPSSTILEKEDILNVTLKTTASETSASTRQEELILLVVEIWANVMPLHILGDVSACDQILRKHGVHTVYMDRTERPRDMKVLTVLGLTEGIQRCKEELQSLGWTW